MVRIKNKRNVFVVSFLTTAFFFLLFRLDIFNSIENVTYDWRMKTFSNKQTTGNVVLIFIGDDTLDMLGEWPISRQWYAGLTEILKVMGAKAVIFDVLFMDNSGEADREFAAAIKKAGNVILPFYFDDLVEKGGMLHSERMMQPLKLLRQNVLTTGFINIMPDRDGVLRKYPLFVKYQDNLYNSLCVSVVEDVLGGRINGMTAGSVEFETPGMIRKVPFSGDYSTYINIYDDLKQFPNYSFIQVFQSYMELSKGGNPMISIDAFEDKIVIVGSTATGAADKAAVSGVANYPLMGVHASFLENFFKGEFIRKAGSPENILISFVFSFVAGSAAVSFSPAAGIIFIVLLAVLFMSIALSLFSFQLIWVDIVPAILSIIFVYGVLMVREFISEKKERLKVKALFSRYISPAVMEKLLGSGEDVQLVGDEKTLTVLFADVRGFTPFAGRHTPEETFTFLNSILSIMSDAVFKYSGTLDKFIGDEVMAIYGAPVDDPKHAVNAVLSAKEMMVKMREFSTDVKIGIGINTGRMIIGNIGTARRMEYTAIGDAVNVAARIEELTAGDEILVGYETYRAIEKEGILCELAGTFSIKGKGEGLALYRVLWGSSGPSPVPGTKGS